MKSQVGELEAKLADVKEKADELETASNNLQQQLGRFQNENWQDVMPNAQESGEEVESAQRDLSESTAN